MPATFETARDEIRAAVKTVWDAGTTAVAGYVPAMFYDGVPSASDPDPAKAYARMNVRHVSGRQASLAGPDGRRRYEKLGIVVVSVFAPIGAAGGQTLGERLAQVAKDALEGRATASGVWFRDAVIAEVGASGPWDQFDVTADFRYDEFK